MRNTFSLFLLLIASIPLSAQGFREWTLDEALKDGRFSIYEGIYHDVNPDYSTWVLSKPIKLDDTYLKITYCAEIIKDTIPLLYGKDRVVTLIGHSYYHSYGMYFYNQSIGNTRALKHGDDIDNSDYHRPDEFNVLINWFVYNNLKEKTITNRHALPHIKHFAIEYTEKQPHFKWSISDTLKVILGYECQKATTSFKGRDWVVWFAPEIPVNCGFWKFSGLPGLIMEVYDAEGFYHFSAEGLEKDYTGIYIYNSPNTIKKLSRNNFRKMEREVFAAPLYYDSIHKNGYQIGDFIGGDISYAYTIFTADRYLVPYFPMELE